MRAGPRKAPLFIISDFIHKICGLNSRFLYRIISFESRRAAYRGPAEAELMRHIGLRYNNMKVDRRKVDGLASWLEENGCTVTVMTGEQQTLPKDIEILVVMGGDGTLLGGARAAAPYGIPVVGIDFGGLGFLSQIKYPQAKASLKRILKGDCRIEERIALQASIVRNGRALKPVHAVNDIVITKKTGRMLRLRVSINGKYFHEFPGDGLILSTATGSTAYALSAGGPIVSPELNVMMLTPICPHTLFARAIVTNGEDEVSIELPQSRDDLLLIIDGQEEQAVKSGDSITVRKAPFRAKYIRMSELHFYETVREKFNLK